MNIPSHLAGSYKLAALRRWANGIRGYYGVAVYLVGSALVKPEPRDWDVRICLPDDEFMRHYAPNRRDAIKVAVDWLDESISGEWTNLRWGWSDDCIKQSRRGWRDTRLNIDFQVYPYVQWQVYESRPRLKLDTREDV